MRRMASGAISTASWSRATRRTSSRARSNPVRTTGLIASASSLPYCGRGPGDHLQLGPLDLGRDLIPDDGRGEPALRRERQALQRNETGGFADPADQLLDGFPAGRLRGDQAQDDHPILRDGSQRLERARPGVVVLEEEAVRPDPREQP